MTTMEEFYTRNRANEGNKLPLYYPDGRESEHWLIVRGIDSDHFRMAESAGRKKALEALQIESQQKRAEFARNVEVETIASLVAGWSFDMPCTPDNVVKFLHEAPQICDMVNRYAAKRTEFYKAKSTSSAIGPVQSSN